MQFIFTLDKFLRMLKRAALLSCASLLIMLGSPSTHAQTQNLVGFWWKPSESGWGLTIQQQGASTFAVWFTYDEQGKAIWYTLTCSFTGSTCAGDLYTGNGIPLVKIVDTANLVAIKVGTGVITATGTNRLSLGYTIGSVTQTKSNLEPQNFAAIDQVPFCSLQSPAGGDARLNVTNYTDHWWGGAAASGWGLQISHQGNQLFGGWYSYNLQGTATWYTVIGTQDPGNPAVFAGTLYKVDPGVPFAGITGPVPPASVSSAGTFALYFTDGAHAVFSHAVLPGGGIFASTKRLGLQRFAVAGGPVNVCTAPAKAALVTPKEASRFLGQATFGPRMVDIGNVSQIGYSAWLDAEFAKPQTLQLPVVLKKFTFLTPETQQSPIAALSAMWQIFATGDDALRQRTAFALSEIFVISLNNSDISVRYPRGSANYLDMLGSHAFGNYRNLLESVTYSPMMGIYLSHMRNRKEDPATGRLPDENYAREVMQLLSIGLHELNVDGTEKRDAAGKPIETYGNADITALAKVFTGLSWGGPDTTDDRFQGDGATVDPDREIKPMQAYNQFHSTSQKQFLGVNIPASGSADANGDVRVALDRLFNHPNVGPFIGKQLIQRLVSSNPTPAYVGRVAATFNNNGAGVRGDMKAVIKAILLDPEARAAPDSTSTRGKIREPVVRLLHWMRSFETQSPPGYIATGNGAMGYRYGDTTYSYFEDTFANLSQGPMHAPSVFNFFRPGYVPPNSRVGTAGLLAPEMQITNETSIATYIRFMKAAITQGPSNNNSYVYSNYNAEDALAANADALMDHVDLLLTGGNMSAATRTLIRDEIAAIDLDKIIQPPDGFPPDLIAGYIASQYSALRWNRVTQAIFLTMVSPDYLFQN